MPKHGLSIFKQSAIPAYLCIINASWKDANSGYNMGVFAAYVRSESLDPIEVIAQATVDIMRSSGLPIAPSHITVVQADKVVRSWMVGRDFVDDDLWERVSTLIERANPRRALAV
jgi:hypothetical protein